MTPPTDRRPARPAPTRCSRPCGRSRPTTCRPMVAAPWPTSTTPGSPTPTPWASRRWRMFAASNGLDPTAFPSLLQMENDLVALAGGLLDAPEGFAGSVTSGGTESILLAVLAARQGSPDITDPSMVIPTSAHAAFHKAAEFLGVRAVLVDVDPDTLRADPAAMAAAIDDTTVLVVASAPSYAHGVVDPVPEIAALAAERGIRCHVDACIGGWVLPHLDDAPPVDLRRRGRHERQRRPAQVRLHAQGRLPAAAPHPGPAPRPLLRLGELARLHDAQQHDAVDPLGRPAGRGVGRDPPDRHRGVCRPGPPGARGDAHDRDRGGRHPRPGRAGPARLDPGRPGHRRQLRRVHHRRRDARARLVRAAAAVLPRRAAEPAPHPVGRHGPLGARAGRGAARVGRRRPRRRPGRRSTPASPACSPPSTRPPSTRPGFSGCSPPPASRATTARSPCPAGWPRSTPCSTPARPRCARRCCIGVLDRLSRPTGG